MDSKTDSQPLPMQGAPASAPARPAAPRPDNLSPAAPPATAPTTAGRSKTPEREPDAPPRRFAGLARARWIEILMVAGVLLLALLVGALMLRVAGTNLSAQGMDYAQLSRNLTAGRSFSTDIVRPLALNAVPARAEFYEFLRAPLFPFVGALAFIVGGAKDATLVALSLAFWAIAAALLWVLALRLTGGNRAVALVSSALWIFSAPIIEQTLQATPATLSAVLVLLMLLALTPHDEATRAARAQAAQAGTVRKKGKKLRPKKVDPERELARRYAWAGALLGACYLSDYVAFVGALALALWWGTGLSSSLSGGWNRKMLGRFALGFGIVALAWWVRNFRLTGNPFYTLQWFELAMGTSAYPGQSLLRDASQSGSLLAVGSSVGEIARKFGRGLIFYFGQVPLLPHLYALPFILGALALPSDFENVRRCQVKLATIVAISATVGALSLLGRTGIGSLVPFAPLLCLLAAIGVQWLFATWQSRFTNRQASEGRNAPLRSALATTARYRILTGVALALVLLLPLYPLARDLSDAKAININTPARQKAFAALGESVPAQRAIVSDVPWEIAWYGKHRALWTPLEVGQLDQVQKRVPVALALFSKQVRQNSGGEWNKVSKGQQELAAFVKTGASKTGDVVFSKEPTIAEAQQTARSKPKDAAAQLSLAKSYLTAGKNREALQAFRKTAQMAPNAPEAYQGIGAASLAAGDVAGAQQAFNKVLQLSPRALLAQMGLADILVSRGQNAAAAKAYEAILADYPDYPLAVNNLAYLYAQQNGDLNLALQFARRAAQAFPDNAEALDTLGWVCYRTGRAAEGAQYLQRAAQLAPKGALIQYHLGKALLASKQPQEGTNALQNALNLGLPAAENNDARRTLANR